MHHKHYEHTKHRDKQNKRNTPVLEVPDKLLPVPIHFHAPGGWSVGGSRIIDVPWRGLSTQSAELSAKNT